MAVIVERDEYAPFYIIDIYLPSCQLTFSTQDLEVLLFGGWGTGGWAGGDLGEGGWGD